MKKILDRPQIEEICQRLGKEISEVLKNEKKIPVFVGVLKGSMNFMMDLIKYIDHPMYLDFIQISSYSGTKSTGVIRLVKDLSYECSNRPVFIIEDIVDTGRSMKYLIEHINSHSPSKIYVCSLFNKPSERVVDVNVDFVGYELKESLFLIGYGLDYYEIERNTPYVYAADKEDIERLDKILKEGK